MTRHVSVPAFSRASPAERSHTARRMSDYTRMTKAELIERLECIESHAGMLAGVDAPAMHGRSIADHPTISDSEVVGGGAAIFTCLASFNFPSAL